MKKIITRADFLLASMFFGGFFFRGGGITFFVWLFFFYKYIVILPYILNFITRDKCHKSYKKVKRDFKSEIF